MGMVTRLIESEQDLDVGPLRHVHNSLFYISNSYLGNLYCKVFQELQLHEGFLLLREPHALRDLP